MTSFAPCGLVVGHATDVAGATGCTVVRGEGRPFRCAAHVLGRATGTRELALLDAAHLVDRVDAILLTGGSAYGLDTASGVMRWMEEHARGFAVGAGVVPIVPAAVLFDLWVGDARIRPDAAAGYAACEASSRDALAQGSVGAGAGATVGKLFGIARAMKGGIGSASIALAGLTVGALVAVNAVGDVIDPATARVLAGARSADGARRIGTVRALLSGELPAALQAGGATTIGIVATDAILAKAQATKVAQMAHDGLARCIAPLHTMFDGDAIFALATGASGRLADTSLVGALAAEAMTRAVLQAVCAASGLPGLPAAGELAPEPA